MKPDEIAKRLWSIAQTDNDFWLDTGIMYILKQASGKEFGSTRDAINYSIAMLKQDTRLPPETSNNLGKTIKTKILPQLH